MAVRGQRFSIDLPSNVEDDASSHRTDGNELSTSAFALPFIGDVQERMISESPKAPVAPQIRDSASGFPAHRNRNRLSSRTQKIQYRKDRFGSTSATWVAPTAPPDHDAAIHERSALEDGRRETNINTEKLRIDQENRQRMARMTEAELEHAREELISGLDPSLIEKLLKRANIDQDKQDVISSPHSSEDKHIRDSQRTRKVVTFDVPEPIRGNQDPDAAPLSPPNDLRPASSSCQDDSDPVTMPLPNSLPFPRPSDPPDLDPSDPSFFDNLHTKYYPALSSDPSKLAWMAPIPNPNSVADRDSPYSPSQQSLPASAIRFDFRGVLLPPRKAREVQVTKGLHHHAEAPEAAGYTIPELARLARSTFPAQRCIAFQTLGRILYRLGKGNYGDEGSELSRGLWCCFEEGKVLEILQGEAVRGGHVSARAYATEAVWNWQKGGGSRWKAG